MRRSPHAVTFLVAGALAALAWPGPVPAAEGMWLPSQLPELGAELRQAGLELDPAELTRLTEPPMNAVIDLGGCTASFVSPDGLIITNHHCVWGDLQHGSTPERNLLEEGFLAASRDAELPASPGSRVRVTVEVTDVTGTMTEGLDSIERGEERHRLIELRAKALVATCEEDSRHRCSVRSYFGGLEHRLIKQRELRDVRLVYAPPRAIGVYGGDADNWMWPRHTGDFAFLRAWVAPDGTPAGHAPDNVPYRPEGWLRISPEGVREGDFVMVVGYPGRTGRHRLAVEVDNRFTWFYPFASDAMAELLQAIEDRTTGRPEAALRYATVVARLNNASKNYAGMLDGFRRGDMLERKRERERALVRWAEDQAEGPAAGAAGAIREMQRLVSQQQATQARDWLLRSMNRYTLLGTARRLYRWSREQELPDAEREPGYQQRDAERFRQRLERLDRSYDPAVDRALWEVLLRRYAELPADQRVSELDAFVGLRPGRGASPKRLDAIYRKTGLGDGERRLAWMDAPAAELEASDDPLLRLAAAMWEGDRARELAGERLAGELLLARPRFMRALLAFDAGLDKETYPDANGSLRVTYGTVRGYSPRDGVSYLPFTTLEGIADKHTGEDPFAAPPRALERIAARDHGRWRLDVIDSVPVNFLSAVDTTGGNSGSPTLDAGGRLVGLLFDGTWDSINADWNFDERTTRSIHADLRYALWVMEKVDRAWNVLEELGIDVRENPRTPVVKGP